MEYSILVIPQVQSMTDPFTNLYIAGMDDLSLCNVHLYIITMIDHSMVTRIIHLITSRIMNIYNIMLITCELIMFVTPVN